MKAAGAKPNVMHLVQHTHQRVRTTRACKQWERAREVFEELTNKRRQECMRMQPNVMSYNAVISPN